MSVLGIKQVLMCDKGTLATTPVKPFAIGAKENASLVISPFKEIVDAKQRKFDHMVNFKAEFPSFQGTMAKLKFLLEHLEGNVDLQILTEKQSLTTSDCFKFNAGKEVGLDFELSISQDKRLLKVIAERAMEYAIAQALIDSADSEVAVTAAGITGEGFDPVLFRVPSYLAFEAPSATPLVISPVDILERSLSMKLKTKKNIFNMSCVDAVVFELSLKFKDASIAKMVELYGKTNSPSILFKEKTSGALYDAFDFAAGVLTRSIESKIGDDERSITAKFSGEVRLFDCEVKTGVTFGGDATDAGTKGGTLKVGY